MGDPPHRPAVRRPRRGTVDRCRDRGASWMRSGPGTRSPRPRRRRLPRSIRHAVLSALPLALLGLGGILFALSRQPAGQAALDAATARILALTGAIGLVVDDIEVEGRETTDRKSTRLN